MLNKIVTPPGFTYYKDHHVLNKWWAVLEEDTSFVIKTKSRRGKDATRKEVYADLHSAVTWSNDYTNYYSTTGNAVVSTNNFTITTNTDKLNDYTIITGGNTNITW